MIPLSKSIKPSKDTTVSNLKTLIRTYKSGFKSASSMIKPFYEMFGYELDRSTISKHLKENKIVKIGGYYRLDDSELTKKEVFTQNLFEQASLKLVSNYEVIFVTVEAKYSHLICQYLQEHEILKGHLLGIIPYQSSIMIFCEKDSKAIVESFINSYSH